MFAIKFRFLYFFFLIPEAGFDTIIEYFNVANELIVKEIQTINLY